MLGIGRRPGAWHWHAVGKHPAAADYLELRGGPAILDAVADWMTKGYAALPEPLQRRPAWRSWRCWLQGARKGRLICGVVRDSSDRLGRPYPLLIIGEGPLEGWQRHWPMLAVRLAKTWERIEQTAARQYDRLQGLADGVAQLEGPGGDAPPPAAAPIPADRLKVCRATLEREGRVIIDIHPSADAFLPTDAQAVAWHTALGGCSAEVPRAVFLGGTPQRSYLAVMIRPLDTSDFVRLWRTDGKD